MKIERKVVSNYSRLFRAFIQNVVPFKGTSSREKKSVRTHGLFRQYFQIFHQLQVRKKPKHFKNYLS